FAGEQFDEALGQYYLRQRYYDASTGRFTRRDTFEGYQTNPISLHRYLYTYNNPILYTDPSGLVTSTQQAAARQIHQILSSSIRLGNTFINTLDKVTATADIIQSMLNLFRIITNPSQVLPLVTRNLNSTVTDQISFLTQPDFFHDAAVTLGANANRIISSVLTTKLPKERTEIAKYIKDKDSKIAFFAPSILQGTPEIIVPTGIRIAKRPVVIATNNRPYRVFGAGMVRDTPRRRNLSIQFFRMDFGKPHRTIGEDGGNWNTWQDGDFHFHIPKN
ncbi:RHS repeat-associated core domain-containing protein, partial [Roseofilum sp. Belize Diploria]|uniref:RHS repeat-associated core domain-containing protein n=1 Tax=Roseofilum sp. Belize Diploria TaxID=2821501 RepID=UPI001B15AFFB